MKQMDDFKILYKKAAKYFIGNQATHPTYKSSDYENDLAIIKDTLKNTNLNKTKTHKPKSSKSQFNLQQLLQNKLVLGITALVIILGGLGYYQFIYKTDELTIDDTATYVAVIDYFRGNVEVKIIDTDEWKTLTNDNIGIDIGTQIKTSSNTKAIITFKDGNILRLNEETELTITDITDAETTINLSDGDVYVRKVENTSEMLIITAEAEYQSLGTAYRVIQSSQIKGVEVYHNKVKFSDVAQDTSKIINEGKKYYLENVANRDQEAEILNIELADIQSDEFVMWNREQDELSGLFETKMGILSDISAPELIILQPTDGTKTEEETITIIGETDADATIYINNVKVDNKGGDFEYEYALNEGENKITIEVVDDSGNKAVKVIIVTQLVTATNTPVPTEVPPTNTPAPTVVISPTDTPAPSNTPIPPTDTPAPTVTPT